MPEITLDVVLFTACCLLLVALLLVVQFSLFLQNIKKTNERVDKISEEICSLLTDKSDLNRKFDFLKDDFDSLTKTNEKNLKVVSNTLKNIEKAHSEVIDHFEFLCDDLIESAEQLVKKANRIKKWIIASHYA